MDLSTEAVERVATKLESAPDRHGIANRYYKPLLDELEEAAALLRALAGEREEWLALGYEGRPVVGSPDVGTSLDGLFAADTPATLQTETGGKR